VVIINSDNSIPDTATVGRVYDFHQTKETYQTNVTVRSHCTLALGLTALTCQDGFLTSWLGGEVPGEAIIAYLNSVKVGGYKMLRPVLSGCGRSWEILTALTPLICTLLAVVSVEAGDPTFTTDNIDWYLETKPVADGCGGVGPAEFYGWGPVSSG